jgi:membrane-associated protein
LEHIVQLLSQYKYLILLPLAIIEGPIIAVIAGFLCSNGLLHLLFVYPVIILGDLIGDSLVYMLGRRGVPRFLKMIGFRFGYTSEKAANLRLIFKTNPIRTISLSKITLGIGPIGIYLAGNSKVPYKKFIGICLATSAVQYIFYLGVGLLFGGTYLLINRYLNYFASLCIVIFLAFLLFYFIQSKLKKL